MNSILLLEAVAREYREMETTLREAMGDAIDGHSLPEAVALLVSQRENARNACAAVMTERDDLLAALVEMERAHGGQIARDAIAKATK